MVNIKFVQFKVANSKNWNTKYNCNYNYNKKNNNNKSKISSQLPSHPYKCTREEVEEMEAEIFVVIKFKNLWFNILLADIYKANATTLTHTHTVCAADEQTATDNNRWTDWLHMRVWNIYLIESAIVTGNKFFFLFFFLLLI